MSEVGNNVYILLGKSEFGDFSIQLLEIVPDITSLFPGLSSARLAGFEERFDDSKQYNSIIGVYESKRRDRIKTASYDFYDPHVHTLHTSEELDADGTLEKLLDERFKKGKLNVSINIGNGIPESADFNHAPEASLLIYLSPTIGHGRIIREHYAGIVRQAGQRPIILPEVDNPASFHVDLDSLGIGDWNRKAED